MPKNRNFRSRTSTFFWSTSARARWEIFFCSFEAPPRGGISRVKGLAPKRCITFEVELPERCSVHACSDAPFQKGVLDNGVCAWSTYLKRCGAWEFVKHLFEKVSRSHTYLPTGRDWGCFSETYNIYQHNTTIQYKIQYVQVFPSPVLRYVQWIKS